MNKSTLFLTLLFGLSPALTLATHAGPEQSTQPAVNGGPREGRTPRPQAPQDPWTERLSVLSDRLQMRVVLGPTLEKGPQLSEFIDRLMALPPRKEASPHAVLTLSNRSADYKMSSSLHLKVGASDAEIKKILDSILPEMLYLKKKKEMMDRMTRMDNLIKREFFFATREEFMTPAQFDQLLATLDRIETQLKKGGKPAKDISQTAVLAKATDALAPKGSSNMTFDKTEIVDEAGNEKSARVMNLFFPLTDAEIKKAFPKPWFWAR